MDARVTRSSARRATSTSTTRVLANTRPGRLAPDRTTRVKGHSHDSDKENAPPENSKSETITEEIPTCGICLDNVKERGVLNSCDHAFCFECIYQWSKTSNTCPMCKARFVQLRKQEAGSKSKRSRSYKVDDVDHRQDDSDFDDWFSSDDEVGELEGYDSDQDTWMYQDYYDNPAMLIDLTESDPEDGDVVIEEDLESGEEEEEEEEDNSEVEESESGSEIEDEESGSDNDCFIINNITHDGDEDFDDVPETPPPRRSSRLQATTISSGDDDVEMEDGEEDSVSSRVAQRRRVPTTRRETRTRSTRATSTTPTTTRSPTHTGSTRTTRNSNRPAAAPEVRTPLRTTRATTHASESRTPRRSPRISQGGRS